MTGVPARIATNLVWVVLATVGLVAGAFLSWTTGLLFDDTYELSVAMPEAGGVLALQEVTVLGRAVGQVSDVEVTEDGVLVTLEIQGDQKVPANGRVQVLRRSPIGEQAVDFQPLDADWAAAEPGSQVKPAEIQVPAPVPFLLEKTRDLFAAVDVEDLGTVVGELATALEGRADQLVQLNQDALELQETLVDGIPTFERLIDTSEPVLAVLEEHRQALASSMTSGADLTEALVAVRPQAERLLDTAPPFLDEFDGFLRAERANISCIVDDLQSFFDLVNGPTTATGAPTRFYDTKLDEVEMALKKNQGFFHGFDIVTQYDPTTGALWNRILFTDDPAGGRKYAQKRPTPATKPGAACVTDPWGIGVDAVRQDDPAPPDPTSPGIDYAPLVGPDDDSQNRGQTTGGDSSTPDNGPSTAATGDSPLPATGGGLAFVMLGIVGGSMLRRHGTGR